MAAEILSNPPPPPPGFVIVGAVFDLVTTALYTPPIRVCIEGTFATSDRLMHFEGASWVDITTPALSSATRRCGAATSLSPFAVMRPASQSQSRYLAGSGGTENPPSLFLSNSAPTGQTAKYKDSTAVNFKSGNPWKSVGTWSASPSQGLLTALGDARLWLGLKNSDDIGTRFDVRVEVWKNGSILLSSGETRCIQGITRNAAQAKEAIVSFGSLPPQAFGATDVLSLNVLTRIGTNSDGTFCGGHSNATGLRLYFESTTRPSRFQVTFW